VRENIQEDFSKKGMEKEDGRMGTAMVLNR